MNIEPEETDPLLVQIIHSEFDADGIDYLMRDATFSGTSFGSFEIDQLISCLTYGEFEGKRILMMHIGGYPGRYDFKAFQLINAHLPDIFICGHSHILKIMNDSRYNMLTINPGAAGIQGFHTVRTALRFRIENGNITDMEVGEWDRKL